MLFGYLSKLLLVRTTAAVLALIAILQMIDLLEISGDIVERGLGLAGVGYYAWLRLPDMFQQVASLGVLVGAMWTFVQLSRDSEMVAMRATGASIYRITTAMAGVVLGAALLQYVVADRIAPRSERALSEWWTATALPPKPGDTVKPEKARWFRTVDTLVSVDQATGGGERLRGVRIYRRDAAGRLVERITAEQATHEAGVWRLHGATVTTLSGASAAVGPPEQLIWRTPMRPADVGRLFSDADGISAGSARRALSGQGAADKTPAYFKTQLQRTWAEPLGVIAMLLLAAPAALANLRSDQSVRLMVFGLGTGLVFLVVDGLLTALGEAGVAPPLLAAWSAPVVFSLLGATALLRLEG